MMRNLLQTGFAAAVAVSMLAPANADASITFQAQGAGSFANLAAAVTFDVVPGTGLVVTLTNTSLAKSLVPTDVLTGVFFSGLTTLTSPSATSSALVASGSTIIQESNNNAPYTSLAAIPTVGGLYNVGGEWAFDTLSGLPHSATKGFSSSGLGVFGGANLNGPNLEDPVALDGLQYGIVTGSTNAGDGNNGMDGFTLIRKSVVFTLTNFTGSAADLDTIGNVSFQYGTALTEPNLTTTNIVVCPGGGVPPCSSIVVETPEPMSLAVMGVGMLGLAIARRRKKAA